MVEFNEDFDWGDYPVKERASIAKKLLKDNVRHKVVANILKDMYKGETVVCLATGASLLDFSPEALSHKIGHLPVFALKMAAVRHEDIVDVCVSNYYNTFDKEVPYLFLARQEAPLGSSNLVNRSIVYPATFKQQFTVRPDVEWGSDNTCLHSQSVCNANRWAENSIENSPKNRILGPGCLNDMAIPVMVHMGVSRIMFMGWDGSDVKHNGTISHFYDVERQFEPTMNSIWPNFDLRNLKADTALDEQEIVRRASVDIKNYLEGEGISISILTKNSTVDEGIHRDFFLYEKKLSER